MNTGLALARPPDLPFLPTWRKPSRHPVHRDGGFLLGTQWSCTLNGEAAGCRQPVTYLMEEVE